MDFSFKTKHSNGKLNPKDVSFFYYEVGFPLEDSASNAVDGGCEMKAWIEKHSIQIGTIAEMPSDYDWEENTLYFGSCAKDHTAQNFLHHLRNGFAHYRITEKGDSYLLEDCTSTKKTDMGHVNKPTMKGAIKKSILKEFVLGFRGQMETLRDNICGTYPCNNNE